MTEDKSYLTREQLRYIRRLSHSCKSQPRDILPMIDLVVKIYNRDKNSNFGYDSWHKYQHDISHILRYWPYLEVHLHIALLDQKFMKNLYSGLENSGPESHYEQNAHNVGVHDYYLSIKDFIPTVRNAMTICS